MKQSKLAFNLLIGTFVLLYILVAFVSTFHAIAFFQLANVMWMGILLAVAYEIGQASVLFAILTTDNNKRLLPWLMMILLTSVQIIGNVYSSFRHIDTSGTGDWQYWQRSILFWLEAGDSEMFKVVISWITGALLPVVALGMTALVAENINLKNQVDQVDKDEASIEDDNTDKLEVNEVEKTIEKDSVRFNGYDDYIKLKDDEGNYKTIDQIEEDIKVPMTSTIEEEELFEANPLIPDEEKISYDEIRSYKEDKLKVFAEELLSPENKLSTDPNAGKIKTGEGGVQIVEDQFEVDIPKNLGSIELNDETLNWEREDGYNDTKEKDISVSKEEDEVVNEKLEPKIVEEEKEISMEKLAVNPKGKKVTKKPQTTKRGWHLKKEYIDSNGDVYQYGVFQPDIKKDPPKKVKG